MKPLAVVLGAALALGGAAAPAQDGAERVAAAVEKWLASDQTSPELLERTVAAVLADERTGLAWLGARLRPALQAPTEPRSKGLQALATHVALAFVKALAAAEMRFAGQYEPLAALQPYVGDLFFGLLLETPDWYPDTHRRQLVPALRDLQPALPAAARVDAVVALAENEAEPEDLRVLLGCMLWQWGKPQYLRTHLERLQRACAEGEADERVRAMLELAALQYLLRDHRAAAATHRSLQALAATAAVPLKPLDWYAAACAHALAGDVERGIAALQRVAELQASPHTDSSHKLARALLEKDPEIAVLRADPRWAAILAQAFGTQKPGAPASGR